MSWATNHILTTRVDGWFTFPFRYEFPETVMLFLAGGVHVLCSKKKGEVASKFVAC
jgi:hypothetical protein